MYKLRLRVGVEHNSPEINHLHPHRFVPELRTDRVLHPAIGDKDPKRAEIRTDCHENGHHEVLRFAQAIPSEEEQPDKCGLEEKRHEPLDSKRGTKDVANIVGVVRPVGSKLKLERNAGRNAQGKIDAEQLSPEPRHVLPDQVASHHIDRFHDDQDPHHPQR